jgi:uncharacterized protein (DUF983 family)
MTHDGPMPSWPVLVLRGLRQRCPHCGKSKLFAGYVTLKPSCAACGEDFSYIHADDAPPWLTIIVTGHIMISLVMMLELNFDLSVLHEVLILVTTACVLTAVLLPICKGVVVTVLWAVGDGR